MNEPKMKHPKYGSFWNYDIPFAFVDRWNEGDTADIVDSFDDVLARARTLTETFVLRGVVFTNYSSKSVTLDGTFVLFKGPDMLLLSREPEFAHHFHPEYAYFFRRQGPCVEWYEITAIQMSELGFAPYNIASITFPPNVNTTWTMQPWLKDKSRERWIDMESVDARLPSESVASTNLKKDVQEKSVLISWYQDKFGRKPDVFEFDKKERFVYLRCRGPCSRFRPKSTRALRTEADMRIDAYGHVQEKEFSGHDYEMVHRSCCLMTNWKPIEGDGDRLSTPTTCLRCDRIKYRDVSGERHVYVGPEMVDVMCDCDM